MASTSTSLTSHPTEPDYLEEVRMGDPPRRTPHLLHRRLQQLRLTGDEKRGTDRQHEEVDRCRRHDGYTDGALVWRMDSGRRDRKYGLAQNCVRNQRSCRIRRIQRRSRRTHNHNHGCAPATGGQVIRILDEVDNPYYSHILDTGQYRGSPGASLGERGVEDVEHNFYGSIETSAPRAVHVRAKIYRIASGSEAWLDYDRIMKIIKSVGFNGWMSVCIRRPRRTRRTTAVPLAAAYLRRKLNEYGL